MLSAWYLWYFCAAVSWNTRKDWQESSRWAWQWIRLSDGTDGGGGEGTAEGATSDRGTRRGCKAEEKGDMRKGKRVRKRYVGVKLSDMRQTDSHGKGHVKWKLGLWQLQGYGLHSYQIQLHPSLLKGNTHIDTHLCMSQQYIPLCSSQKLSACWQRVFFFYCLWL